MHGGIEIIEVEKFAFSSFQSLRGVKFMDVKVIEQHVFAAAGWADVEFGDKLETMGDGAFENYESLRTSKCLCQGHRSICILFVNSYGCGVAWSCWKN